MSADEVRINIAPEIELHDKKDELMTSPLQEQVTDTTIASENGSSDKKLENGTSPPQDLPVLTTKMSTEIQHDKKDEFEASRPQEQAVRDTTSASGNGKSRPQDVANDQSINEDFKKLYETALKNDWNTAYKDIFKEDPSKNSEYLKAKISDKGDTALHIAVATESSMFVRKLVYHMKKEDLTIKNGDGNTAFCLVAASGSVELAKVMFTKNEELLGIRGAEDMLPIHVAAKHGHEKMMEFLLGVTKDELAEEDDKKLKDLINKTDLSAAAAAASFIQYPPSKIELHEEEDELVAVPPQGQDDDRGINEDIKKLYRAALSNDWLTYDWNVFKRDPDKISKYLTTSISENDNNALHVAAAADSYMVVLKLAMDMTEKDLAIRNGDGYTAFCLLAASSRVELADLMFRKNKKLPSIRGDDEMLPIHVAAQHGNKKMVKYLYEVSKDELTEKDRIQLIRNLISRADLFDEALQLLEDHKNLATANLGYAWRWETALHILAGTPLMSPNLANQNQQGILNRYFNISVSDSDKLPAHEKLSPQTLKLLHLLLKKVDYGGTRIDEVINVAVAKDNIELLSMIICHYPELICKVEGDTDTCGRIFCNAVWKRQKDIFKLLKENVGPRFQRKLLQKVHQYKDDKGNNILHYAGKSPPSDKLDTISGVAFQLQQELLWFQEVNKIVNPLVAEAKNKKSQTPKALFSEEHKQLKEKGEKWMKDTANSCMIVATLIATVVFAAAFTVPGGIKEESGTPHFAHKLSFKIFVISDAISLVLSVYSILTFLSILTSRYAEEDFLSKLPKKLVMGLVTLLLSIAAMMAVFVTTVFIVFKVEKIWVRVLLCLIASLPVIELAKQNCPLLFDVARLMFKRSFLFEDRFWNWLKAKYMYFGYVRRRCYRRCRNSFWSIRHTLPVSKGTKM